MFRSAHLTYRQKLVALRKAVKKACRFGISSHQLDLIVENLNVNRQYCIKSTRDHGKFLNIVTEEFVATSDRKRISFVTKIYGDFICGRFFRIHDTSHSISGYLNENSDSAALKRTVVHNVNNPPIVTYTLILYKGSSKTA